MLQLLEKRVGTLWVGFYKSELIESYKMARRSWRFADANDDISYDPYTTETDITKTLKNRISNEQINISNILVSSSHSEDEEIKVAWVSEKDNCAYILLTYSISDSTSSSTQGQATVLGKNGVCLYKLSVEGAKSVGELAGTTVTEEVEHEGDEVVSSAYILQGIISKWYKALRLIALVGLMSVLVYVGIRIILSSTGQEKAKYKKMLGDWLVAICILFVLQYIMVFIVQITSNLINIFPNTISEFGGRDKLISDLRQEIGDGETFYTVFGETIMYVALVVLTCIFTIHYLKRLIYLAFLTMIAPLIALTYPLDKIKDRTSTSIFNVVKRICI